MSAIEAKTLSRLVQLEGEAFLFSPEYDLCVQPTDSGYQVLAHPVSYDEDRPYENLFLGGRSPVIISDGLSGEELDVLFDLIDKDLAHALE
jgi:hypothetical protein